MNWCSSDVLLDADLLLEKIRFNLQHSIGTMHIADDEALRIFDVAIALDAPPLCPNSLNDIYNRVEYVLNGAVVSSTLLK